MKYYILTFCVALTILSCTTDKVRVYNVDNIISLWGFSNGELNSDIIGENLTPMINETNKTLTVELESIDIRDEIELDEKLNGKQLSEIDLYDFQFSNFYSENASIIFKQDFNNWIGKVSKFELMYFPIDENKEEILLGEYFHDENGFYIFNFEMSQSDLTDEFTNEPGNVSLKIIFEEMPEEEIVITNYTLDFGYAFKANYNI
jgi:hypothetical protein